MFLLKILLISSTLFAAPIPEMREFPLNKDINPCENFHQYVCSKVESSFQLPNDRNYHSFAFDDSSERLLEKKKKFFKTIHQEKNLDERSLQLKNYYMACMNLTSSITEEKVEVKARQADYNKIKTSQDFWNMIVDDLYKDGSAALLGFGNTESVVNPKEYVLYLGMNIMSLPERSYYENPALAKDYQEILSDFLKIIHPKISNAELTARTEAMFNLEKKFANEYPLPAVRRERWAENHIQTQSEFLSSYPELKLQKLFSKIPEKIKVTNNFPEGWLFFQKYLNEESLTTFKDIWLFKTLKDIMDDAYPQWYAKRFQLRKKYFGGPLQRPPRQERCTQATESAFNMELDALLIKRFFPEFPEEKFIHLAQAVRASIVHGLENNSWLSKGAKEAALKKMTTARLQLVQPRTDKEWDFELIRKYSPKQKLANMKILGQAQIEKMLTELPEEVNKDKWAMGPLTINAYYDPSQNKFVMPIGILQYPFFNPQGDLIENLGAVGTVIAHELGHGIDDNGSRFDSEGKLNKWMTEKDLAEFSAKTKKLVTQFDQTGHNGQLTLGENIADVVGLGFSFNTAFPNTQSMTKENLQKFFTAYARLWCYVARPDAKKQQLKVDPHALGDARINEQVKHRKEFAEAFSCKPTDKMILSDENKVQVW